MRVLARDDPAQVAVAEEAVSQDFLITSTVLLETEWVLRSSYGWSREQRVRGLEFLLDLPHAVVFPAYARWALAQAAKGADFADMMHIASAEGASSFGSFERRLKRLAGRDTPIPVEFLS